jgi:hypothetical protein
VRLARPKRPKNPMFSLIGGFQIKGKHNKGIGLWSHDEARAHKGGMRIGKKRPPKKNHDSIWCPQCKGANAENLKQ